MPLAILNLNVKDHCNPVVMWSIKPVKPLHVAVLSRSRFRMSLHSYPYRNCSPSDTTVWIILSLIEVDQSTGCSVYRASASTSKQQPLPIKQRRQGPFISEGLTEGNFSQVMTSVMRASVFSVYSISIIDSPPHTLPYKHLLTSLAKMKYELIA